MFDQREVPLYTFGQLEQQPRMSLKNRAMNLRDLIGAERLPALSAAGAKEEVIVWIIDVQCMLAKATGLDITPAHLGVPADFNVQDDGLMAEGDNGHRGQPESQPPLSQRAGDGDAYAAAMNQAAMHKMKNQRGSNIFGGDDEPTSARVYSQRSQPMPELSNRNGNGDGYALAMNEAAMHKAKNQRGSNIFGGDEEPKHQQQYQPPRQPMHELQAPPGHSAAAMEAAQHKARNMRGSNIFG